MMTTTPNAPDAALLWARERCTQEMPSADFASGKFDHVMHLCNRAEAFRAGQSHADAGLLAGLEPVRHWYQSDEHPKRPMVEVISDIVRDLQHDRALALRAAALQADAARYRWLRDQSVPPHNFYISVPDEFHGVRYRPDEVDAYIDAAIAAAKGQSND